MPVIAKDHYQIRGGYRAGAPQFRPHLPMPVDVEPEAGTLAHYRWLLARAVARLDWYIACRPWKPTAKPGRKSKRFNLGRY